MRRSHNMHFSSKLFKQLICRNRYCRHGKKAKEKQVNLEYFDSEVNLGDALSPVIYKWMLDRKSIDFQQKINQTKHLMAIGSILGGNGFFDATVWGSGIKSFDQVSALGKRKYFQKLDIRAVRGPLTREALLGCGYQCPHLFGDPAVLMPKIYHPHSQKGEKTALVSHFLSFDAIPEKKSDSIKKIDIKTTDYAKFIDELAECDKVISSSLHGIILAESYGIPAVFLGKGREGELLKYYDWYFSTKRTNIKIAHSIDEALEIEPLPLPELDEMRSNLISSFPYDLWANE